jgi:GntR family transcriptional regulator
MLHLQLDPHSGIPVFRQMMDQIKYYAASGALQPGDRLPSIRELAKGLSVNPTTVVKAYTELEHEGVIERKQGKGVYLRELEHGMSDAERREALRRLARQLAIETVQMGAALDLAQAVVAEEFANLRQKGSTA